MHTPYLLNRQVDLSTMREISERQLSAHARLVRRLQEAGTQSTMNVDGSADDLAGLIGLNQA